MIETEIVETYKRISHRALRAYEYMRNPKISIEEKRKRYDAYIEVNDKMRNSAERFNAKEYLGFISWLQDEWDKIDAKYRQEAT